ncbi:MAG: ATP-binding protein [Bacteroidaceae bacterium]
MNMEYIHRDMERVVEEASRYFPVITITGPRQSGKTTMLRHIFQDLPYYTMEDIDTRKLAIEDPVRFLNESKEGMMLDEVHNVPELLSYIQGIVDREPQRRFILSGSSNFSLLKNVSQSLAGRTAVFELLPFSYRELSHDKLPGDINELLYRGLYPAICSGSNVPKFLYPAYIKTYLERDVRKLQNVKDIMLFATFLRLCAGRIGSVFNASELANEVGVTVKTIQAWISVLQTSYVVYLMPPYYENSRKRLTKSPKLYFCDTGLACALMGIESPEQLAYNNMRGHLFENMVVMELLKRRFNEGREGNLYFYRDSNQNEVDILAGNEQGMQAYEVKSAMTYHPSFEHTLRKIDGWISPQITRRAVIYTGQLESRSGDIELLNYMNL